MEVIHYKDLILKLQLKAIQGIITDKQADWLYKLQMWQFANGEILDYNQIESLIQFSNKYLEE